MLKTSMIVLVFFSIALFCACEKDTSPITEIPEWLVSYIDTIEDDESYYGAVIYLYKWNGRYPAGSHPRLYPARSGPHPTWHALPGGCASSDPVERGENSRNNIGPWQDHNANQSRPGLPPNYSGDGSHAHPARYTSPVWGCLDCCGTPGTRDAG